MTERDVDILAFVARVRLATTDQIIRFTAGSEKNVGNRIRHLYYHSYLDRVDDQLALVKLFNLVGNTSPVYGLARAGKQLLATRGITPTKHRAKSPLIPHTVAGTEFVLQCAVASRVARAPRFLHQSDLVLPEKTRALDHPHRFRVAYHDGLSNLSLNVDPDIRVSLLFPDNHQHNACVEIDLGTETVARRRNGKIVLSKSTIARKLAGYHFGAKEGRHREQWGWNGFRVLMITTSDARICSMLDAQAEITNGTGVERFLYTTLDRIKTHGAFAPIWTSASGDGISIIDR